MHSAVVPYILAMNSIILITEPNAGHGTASFTLWTFVQNKL